MFLIFFDNFFLSPQIECSTMADEHQSTGSLKKLYLWANYRSLGTIFLKWLSNLEDSKVINGMFTSAYFYGVDSKGPAEVSDTTSKLSMETDLSEFPFIYDASQHTYESAKEQVESVDYPGMKYLICKDLPFSLCGNHDLIPAGFRHTFLIRHPYKMFSSWKAILGRLYFPGLSLPEIFDSHLNKHYNYKEQYELLRYLQEHPELGDPNPIVLDADDLLNHPERILPQYCQAIGVPYADDMLKWKPGREVVNKWMISRQLCGGGFHNDECGFYKTAMESSSFLPAKKLPERDELDEDVLACADITMPYYDLMYNMRNVRP